MHDKHKSMAMLSSLHVKHFSAWHSCNTGIVIGVVVGIVVGTFSGIVVVIVVTIVVFIVGGIVV